VNWAIFGVADLARSIGWDISRVLEDESHDDTAFLIGNEAVITEAQLLESLKADGPGTILTIRQTTGEVRDYLFSDAPYQILSLGSKLSTMLQ
jgi:hypothetical protein